MRNSSMDLRNSSMPGMQGSHPRGMHLAAKLNEPPASWELERDQRHPSRKWGKMGAMGKLGKIMGKWESEESLRRCIIDC